MDMMDNAFSYTDIGWFVFPIKEKDKIPATQHGHNDSSRDTGDIVKWWQNSRDLNIGIDCGRSNIVVVDVDPKNGGINGLTELVKTFGDGIFDTVQSETGGGGRHVIYSAPPEIKIHNSVSKLGQGIDIRATGGYILAPPSIHPSGLPYKWREARSPFERKLAPFPQEFIEILTADTTRMRRMPPVIANGTRNNTLASLAGTLRIRGLEFDEIMATLRAVNKLRCRPPLDDEELLLITSSIMRY